MERFDEASGLAEASKLGARWGRRWQHISWREVEPTEGEYDWEVLDGLAEEFLRARDSGIEPIVEIQFAPQWAQKVVPYACGPIRADKFEAFAAFMEELVTRYGPSSPYGVRHWQLGNEMDVAPEEIGPESVFGCWGDLDDPTYGGEHYGEMLKVVYPRIKAADPQAQVMVGGLLLECDPYATTPGNGCKNELRWKSGFFLDGIMRAGGGEYFDVIDVHSYALLRPDLPCRMHSYYDWSGSEGGTGLPEKVAFVRRVIAEYGYDNKSVIAGELALKCEEPTETCYDVAAAFVPRAYAEAYGLDLLGGVYYTLISPDSYPSRYKGLLRPDGSARPAYWAYSFMSQQLGDSRYEGPVTEYAAISGHAFERAGGRQVQILWSTDGTDRVIDLAAGVVGAYDKYGDPLLPDAGRLTVGWSPVYLAVEETGVALEKTAEPSSRLGDNDALTYTLTLTGPTLNATLSDPLPPIVEYITDSLTSTTTPAAVYSPTVHAVVWEGPLAADRPDMIRFQVTPSMTTMAALSQAPPIVNTAWLTDTRSGFVVSDTVIVNAQHAYLPLAMRSRRPTSVDWQPALSPDDQQVVFVREEPGKQTDVFLMNAGGSGLRNLTQTPDDDEDTPVFSPDGAKIAFASDREGQWDIYWVNPSETDPTARAVISSTGSDEVHPFFSPDGDVLAFSSNRASGNWDIYTATINGRTWARLTSDPSVERFPVFGADGRTLAYRREVHGDSEIYVMDVVSQTTRRLTESPGFDGYPALTPDGSGVVFVSNRSNEFQLYGMNIAGSGVLTLTERAGYRAHTPRLSRDGQTLIYAAAPTNGSYGIYTTTYQSPLEVLASRGATDTQGQCDWTSGVFAVGWGTAWRGTGNEAYARRIQDWADSCASDTYPIAHVNDGLLGYGALVAYQFDPQPNYLAFAERVADYLMNTAPRTSDGALAHFDAQMWDDTLISAVPFFVEMHRVTRDQHYLDEAATQTVLHAEILQDPATGLFRHAWSEDAGEYLSASYWARGNSWNMIASAQLLHALPVTHALRSQIVSIAQDQAEALAALQDPGGLWHTVVDRPEFYLESSGSAGIAYGLGCGVQDGWLPADLENAVQVARLGLWRKVSADGTVTDVSGPTGPMRDEEAYNAIPKDALQLY
ncbi:MAG: glycoside hydrolase family 88 protein, partial [Anaerolineae bacterium]